MALLSSGYPAAFQSGLTCNGLLSIGVPSAGQLPYPNLSMMRVPPHIAVGFSMANLSAAYFQSSQRSDTDFPTLFNHQSPLHHTTHARTNTSVKRKGVTNFSIAGILGRDEDTHTEKCTDDSPSKSTTLEESPSEGHASKIHVKTEGLSSPKGEDDETDNPLARFSWLQCTRYKPPRLPSKFKYISIVIFMFVFLGNFCSFLRSSSRIRLPSRLLELLG